MEKTIRKQCRKYFFLRGFFIDRTIDIEYKLIKIIAQYCTEQYNEYDKMIHTLMKKEIAFNVLIKIFNECIIPKQDNMTQRKINCFQNKLFKVGEIRNKFAHWIYINSDNLICNSEKRGNHFSQFVV